MKKILVIIFALFSGFCYAQNEQALRAATEPAVGVAQDQSPPAGEGLERGGDFPLLQEDSAPQAKLPHLFTYVDSPVVEQRQIYTADEIEKMHIADLPSLFQAAGIQILSYGTYGLEQKPSIRGFTDETVRVVIDGVCVNNPQYGTFDFTTLNVNDIEKIEIVRGGFTESISAEDAVAGVIYITTKKQAIGHSFFSDIFAKTFFNKNMPVDMVSLAFGYNGQFSENTFFKSNIKLTEAQNKYLYKTYKNTTGERKNSDVYDGQVSSRVSHFFSNGSSWSINDIAYAGYKNTPNVETSIANGIQQDYDNNLSFNLNFPSINRFCSMNNTTSWISSTRFYEENGAESKHYLNTVSNVHEINFFGNSFLNESLGMNLAVSHLNSTDDGIHTIFSASLKETTKLFFGRHFAVSLPQAIKVSGKNAAFLPKIGFSADFFYLEILLNGYRMIQFPNMDDLYWAESDTTSGNPNLKPEKGWGAEITFNAKNIFIPFSMCFYTNYYEQKIQWAQNSKKWMPQNIASAFYAGMNISAEKTFFEVVTLRGNFEYLYNILLDESNKLTYKKHIMWTPDIVASVIINLHLSVADINFEANYTGKRYTSNMNLYYVKPYCLFNASAELTLWTHCIPYLRIDNILNTDYISIPDYPMPRASLTAGIKAKW